MKLITKLNFNKINPAVYIFGFSLGLTVILVVFGHAFFYNIFNALTTVIESSMNYKTEYFNGIAYAGFSPRFMTRIFLYFEIIFSPILFILIYRYFSDGFSKKRILLFVISIFIFLVFILLMLFTFGGVTLRGVMSNIFMLKMPLIKC